jgi:hypothetical protein
MLPRVDHVQMTRDPAKIFNYKINIRLKYRVKGGDTFYNKDI